MYSRHSHSVLLMSGIHPEYLRVSPHVSQSWLLGRRWRCGAGPSLLGQSWPVRTIRPQDKTQKKQTFITKTGVRQTAGLGQTDVSNPEHSPKGTEWQAGSGQAEWSTGRTRKQVYRKSAGRLDKINWQQTNKQEITGINTVNNGADG
jgi:hypothetical protein